MSAALLALMMGSFSASPVEKASERANSLVRFIEGRILGVLVRPGMTEEEVAQLIGRKCTIFLCPSSPMLAYYYQHGLTVCFEPDKDGVIRATSVGFVGSLCDVFK
jgi:hypothetical protein